MSLAAKSVEELRALLSTGGVSASEIFTACERAADGWDGELASLRVRMSQPTESPAQGLLAGIPYTSKGNIAVEAAPLTCSSRILGGYVPPYDATVTRKLREAGAVLLGQTNMDEFAMGSSTENSAYGPSKNPWNRDRTPGGSSGGSAACVGAGIVPFALGSDTGGSIRQPAGFCGCVGLKPTYGRVSRYGLVAFASSLDQIGPITRTVRDCALVYAAIAGHDRCDATSLPEDVDDVFAGIEDGCRGLKVGVPTAFLTEGLDDDVRADFDAVLNRLEQEGAEIVEIDLGLLSHSIATYYILATAEASSNLARFDGVRYGLRAEAESLDEMYRRTRTEGFGDEVKLRILLGTYVLSAGYYDAYYRKAGQLRTLMRRQMGEAFERCHVIATPTSPTTAFRLGERVEDPLQMYLSDIFTVPANLTGVPSLAVPTSLDGDGLPLSIQFMARPLDEAGLLRAGRAVERLCNFDALRARIPQPPEAS